jgi:tRNA (cytidine/uridine-2'-O-)-methyltransferase
VFHLVLYEPEIPPNTGNVIRLCANTGASLHLIHPLGFDLDDTKLRRAGLDYREWATIEEHQSLGDFMESVRPKRLFVFTTRARRCYADVGYQRGDGLLFGPESRGLPSHVLRDAPEDHRLYVPMVADSRSLNLSNAAALVLYEAWRQLGFCGAARK